MESRNQAVDAALEAWNELCSTLKAACSERKLEFRHYEAFSLLIHNKGSLRVWFLPELKKLRYNAGITGWQELSAIDRGEQPMVFQTPHRQQYSVQELCDLMLGLLQKPSM